MCYVSAGKLFSDFETEKFRLKEDGALTGEYLQTDLLIIDDLGTEMTTQFTVSALYQIVNGRLLSRKTHDCLDKSSGHGARGALLGADCLAAAGGIYALSVLRDGCAAAAENGKQGLTNRLAGTGNGNFNWNGLGASLRGSLLF